ncbi:hypothetical protein O6H91_01G079900 [Diphasiastrum complanatum]|uniref:Uncharacterized protein n=2 Tax=Diphasiastrum complanatum TaxID=34168 RepID=A0ACC2ESL3_DIPCM|nr:hypothetical protein O6H91_01G030600 [Diphasiastrum complanatum]KAJ7569475.1 hypothetical protein O6H91_01G079900 [Diphasiastrum complanatum]
MHSTVASPEYQLSGSLSRPMATLAAAAVYTPVAGLGAVRLKTLRPRSRLQLSSSFLGCEASPSNALQAEDLRSISRVTCFKRDWLRRDLSVIGFGLIGWLAPSSIPAINGQSLTGLFFNSIGSELSHWPTGPALNSQFWLWMITWHLGLFIVLTLGQIGFKGRQDQYF